MQTQTAHEHRFEFSQWSSYPGPAELRCAEPGCDETQTVQLPLKP